MAQKYNHTSYTTQYIITTASRAETGHPGEVPQSSGWDAAQQVWALAVKGSYPAELLETHPSE